MQDLDSPTYFSAIDIGTNTIKVAISELLPDGSLEIIGHSESESLKVRKGEILDPTMVADELSFAISAAEKRANVRLCDTALCVPVSSLWCRTNICSGTIAAQEDTHQLTEEDASQAVINTRKTGISDQYIALATSTRYYTLSDKRDVLTPVGHVSPTLDVSVLSILAQKKMLQTPLALIKSVLNFSPAYLEYGPLCTARAVLTGADLENAPQLVIDVGAGVTSYALITRAGCLAAGGISVGTDHIANDLAIAYDLAFPSARNLVRDFPRINFSLTDDAWSQPGRKVAFRRGFAQSEIHLPTCGILTVVRERLVELFDIIRSRLAADVAAWGLGRIHLAGGGSMLPGLPELVSEIFDAPAVLAVPQGMRCPDASLHTHAAIPAMGAMLRGLDAMRVEQAQQEDEEPARKDGSLIKTFLRNLLKY